MSEPIKFIRVLKGPIVLGDRTCHPGDVIQVRGLFDRERSLLPIVPRVDQDRAAMLIDRKFCAADPGPARYGPVNPPVEHATNPPRAERAVLKR